MKALTDRHSQRQGTHVRGIRGTRSLELYSIRSVSCLAFKRRCSCSPLFYHLLAHHPHNYRSWPCRPHQRTGPRLVRTDSYIRRHALLFCPPATPPIPSLLTYMPKAHHHIPLPQTPRRAHGSTGATIKSGWPLQSPLVIKSSYSYQTTIRHRAFRTRADLMRRSPHSLAATAGTLVTPIQKQHLSSSILPRRRTADTPHLPPLCRVSVLGFSPRIATSDRCPRMQRPCTCDARASQLGAALGLLSQQWARKGERDKDRQARGVAILDLVPRQPLLENCSFCLRKRDSELLQSTELTCACVESE